MKKKALFHQVSNNVGLFTDTLVDVTSVNFNSKKVYEDEISGRPHILQFFSGEFKGYKYVKFPQTLEGHFTVVYTYSSTVCSLIT